MNLFKKLVLLSMTGMLLSAPVFAIDEPFQAQIVIKQPITVIVDQNLDFGIVFATGAPQTIVQAPVVAGSANFTITGEALTPITVSVVEAAGITLAGGASTITVDTFVLGGSITGGAATFDGAGGLASAASVGATVNIPLNPSSGTYTGNLNLRVIY